jgi:small-conductance mechanosensitive channel
MFFQPVLDALTQTLNDILSFLPHFVNGLIVLIVGYFVSALVRWIVRLALRLVRLNQLAQRSGITNALTGLGIRTPIAEIIAQIFFFFLLLSFATSATQLMGLTTVATLLQNVLGFVPRAVSAALILIFGSMLARFLGGTVTSLGESVNITYAGALGRIIEYAILAFLIVLAISTLGVDTTILTTSLTIIIAASGLALALTFAYGARDSARNVIAGYYVRQAFRPGQRVSVNGHDGTILSTSGAYTTLNVTNATGERSTVALPNTVLLSSTIQSGVNGGNNEGNTGSTPAPTTPSSPTPTSPAAPTPVTPEPPTRQQPE